MLADQVRTSSDLLVRRRRRARLTVTVALHVSMLALTVALLPLGRIEWGRIEWGRIEWGRIEQVDSLVIIIALTDREIVITVGSGSGRATHNPKTQRIALADVTARSATVVKRL